MANVPMRFFFYATGNYAVVISHRALELFRARKCSMDFRKLRPSVRAIARRLGPFRKAYLSLLIEGTVYVGGSEKIDISVPAFFFNWSIEKKYVPKGIFQNSKIYRSYGIVCRRAHRLKSQDTIQVYSNITRMSFGSPEDVLQNMQDILWTSYYVPYTS